MAPTDYIGILQSEWGWAIVLVVGLYEIAWPFWDTRFQTLLNEITEPVREDVNRIEGKIDRVDDKAHEIQKNQISSIQVVRAMSRQMDGIDDERVDEYLADNGVTPDEFVRDGDSRGDNRGFTGDD